MIGRTGRAQSGQAIVLAVVLLVLMAIMGATFVALISHSMTTTTRTSDVLAAQEAADSGIAYVHHMFMRSPEGADFRLTWPVLPADIDPPGPTALDYYTSEEIMRGLHRERFVKLIHPVESGDPTASMPLPVQGATGELQRGRTMVKIEYVPSDYLDGAGALSPLPYFSLNPLSRFIRVVSVGSTPSSPGVFRMAVAYIPLLITDQLITITDIDRSEQPQALGGPTVLDYDGDGFITDFDTPPNGLQYTDELVSLRFNGGLFSNTGVSFYGGVDDPGAIVGPAFMEWRLNQLPAVDPRAGNFFFGDRIAAAGPFSMNAPPGGAVATVSLANAGFPLGVLQPSYLGSVPNSAFSTLAGLYVDDLGYLEGWRLINTAVGAPFVPFARTRAVSRVEAPRIDRADTSGRPIIEASVRESGRTFEVTAPVPVSTDPAPSLPGTWLNTAQMGLGVSLYIDNPGDVQSDNLDDMVNEWLRRGPGADAATWYGRLYVPPGAEIIFLDHDYHDPANPGDTVYSIGRQASSPARPYGNDPTVPDIIIRLSNDAQGAPQYFRIPVSYDGANPPVYDPINPNQTIPFDPDGDGTPATEAIFDYPQDGVILVAGNARVRGRLPSLASMVAWDPTVLPRTDWEYNVSLYSGGNIYVEGNLLRPSDVNPAVPELDTAANLTANSRIALMARGSVVVNGTQLPIQDLGGSAQLVVEERGREGRSHWRVGPQQWLTGRFSFAAVDDWDGDGFAGADWDGDGTIDCFDIDTDLFLKLRIKGDPGGKFDLFVNGIQYDFNDMVGQQPFEYLTGRVQTVRIPLRHAQVDYATMDDTPGAQNSFALRAASGMRSPIDVYAVAVEARTGGTQIVDALLDDPDRPETLGFQVSGLIYGGDPYPIDTVISALMYAQQGTFFVIPGEFFDPSAGAIDHNGDGIVCRDVYVDGDAAAPGIQYTTTTDMDGDGVPEISDVDLDFSGVEDWRESRRYNQRITINGAIAQNKTADILAVAAWSDKFSWHDTIGRVRALPDGPAMAGASPQWGQVRYVYDPGLRAGRQLYYTYQTAGGVFTARDYRPRFPRLPVSADIIYAGNVVPPAGS